MYYDVLTMVTAGMKNAGWGVNAQITNLITGSLIPANTPQIATIVDETGDIQVARGLPAQPYPSLSIMSHGSMKVDAEISQNYREFPPQILIRYAALRSDTDNGASYAHSHMRAVVRALKAFTDNSNAASRSQNGVQLFAFTDMEVYAVTAGTDDNTIITGIVLTFDARDYNI